MQGFVLVLSSRNLVVVDEIDVTSLGKIGSIFRNYAALPPQHNIVPDNAAPSESWKT